MKTKRYEKLAQLVNENKFKYIAEIGVRDGETTQYILDNCPSVVKYFAIDINPILGKHNKLEPIIGRSCEVVKKFKNFTLDLVFIDADHSYEAVKEDITKWRNKVKNNGMLTGHDYLNSAHRGVEKAVNELYPNVNYDEDCFVWWVNK